MEAVKERRKSSALGSRQTFPTSRIKTVSKLHLLVLLGMLSSEEANSPTSGDAEGSAPRVPGRGDPQGVAFQRRGSEEPEVGPHGPIFREFYHDAEGCNRKAQK